MPTVLAIVALVLSLAALAVAGLLWLRHRRARTRIADVIERCITEQLEHEAAHPVVYDLGLRAVAVAQRVEREYHTTRRRHPSPARVLEMVRVRLKARMP